MDRPLAAVSRVPGPAAGGGSPLEPAITRDARPALAEKASLRHDRFEGKDILLYPERGLSLNPVGSAVARRCDGAHTVAEIVAAVTASFLDAPPGEVERDVMVFLERLRERGLLEGTG